MLSPTSASGTDDMNGTDHVPELERLLAAAVRLAPTLSHGRATLGILRGWNHTDRERARALRERLSHHAVDTVELSPAPEAEERHRTPGGRRRPRVDLLVHAGSSQGEQARRAAALWRLPLLIEREDSDGEGELNAFGAHRRAAIGVRLTGGGFDVAVREVTLVSLQSQSGHAHLILDNEKVTAPADRPLTAGLTPDGVLEVRSDTFGTRRVRRMRYERPWGICRLDVDGTPAHDVRAPLRLEALPGCLHLLHP